MQRVREYVQFAVWFVGLGYIVLWPLTAHDDGIAILTTSFVCGGGPFELVNLICHAPHVLKLSPGLHLIGMISAVCIVLRLLIRQLSRPRRVSMPAVRNSDGPPQQPKPSWQPSPRPVKPRKQFGLRNTAH